MFSRSLVFFSAAILAATTSVLADSSPHLIVVGTSDYATVPSQIITLSFDPTAKTISVASTHNLTGDVVMTPSWITQSPTNKSVLVATGESCSMLHGLTVGQKTGNISEFGTLVPLGLGPVHAVFDKDGDTVYTASYGNGSNANSISFTNGVLGPAVNDALNYTSTNTTLSPYSARPHGVFLHPQGDVGYVPLLANNVVSMFYTKAGKFTKLKDYTPPAGVIGARHMAINANGTNAYLTAETSATITSLKIDSCSAGLSTINTHSLANGGGNLTNAAEVTMTKNGKFVYATVRATGLASDFVAAMNVTETGDLSTPVFTSSGGTSPRSAAVSPDDDYLVVGNEIEKIVTIYSIDQTSGALSLVATSGNLTQPPAAFVWLN